MIFKSQKSKQLLQCHSTGRLYPLHTNSNKLNFNQISPMLTELLDSKTSPYVHVSRGHPYLKS